MAGHRKIRETAVVGSSVDPLGDCISDVLLFAEEGPNDEPFEDTTV